MQDNILVALRGNRKRSIVANDLNITTQMLGAIERGTRKPSRTLTKKIADYYGVTSDSIIFFIENRNKMCPCGVNTQSQ